jgi:hypothetical protein
MWGLQQVPRHGQNGDTAWTPQEVCITFTEYEFY